MGLHGDLDSVNLVDFMVLIDLSLSIYLLLSLSFQRPSWWWEALGRIDSNDWE